MLTRSWEPSSSSEWMQKDPFRAVDIPIMSGPHEQEQAAAFDSWNDLPSPLRQQAWREREIAAQLYALTRERLRIPGMRTIGVAMQGSGAQRVLVGLILCESVPPSVLRKFYRENQIPESLPVPSVIPKVETTVPLRIENESAWGHRGLSQVSPDRSVRTSDPLPLPVKTPTLQAGDVIAGEDQAGFRTLGTLSAIVSRKSDVTPLLLSVAHIFRRRGQKVIADVPIPVEVGKVVDLDPKLDAAIVELKRPWIVDYRIKALNVVPAAPVMPVNDMPVQFVGGVSGHQVGWLDVTNSIPVGGESAGVIPDFRATMQSQEPKPGDSGASLFTGHGRECPINAAYSGNMYSQYAESMTCAMLGILIAGPSRFASPTTRPQVYFRPILSILDRFQLQVWCRKL